MSTKIFRISRCIRLHFRRFYFILSWETRLSHGAKIIKMPSLDLEIWCTFVENRVQNSPAFLMIFSPFFQFSNGAKFIKNQFLGSWDMMDFCRKPWPKFPRIFDHFWYVSPTLISQNPRGRCCRKHWLKRVTNAGEFCNMCYVMF